MIRAEDLTTNRQYFYKLEAETGVKLEVRQSTATKADPKATYIPTVFSLTVDGDYRQLLTFLRALENGPHYSRVLSASCNSAPNRGEHLVLGMNLELLGFP